MANKNDKIVVAYYASEAAARNSAEVLKAWDQKSKDVKLGAIAIITLDPTSGEIKAEEVGQKPRKTKSGALWGTAVGAAVGLLTGGIGLIPAALLGAGGGGAIGAMSHKQVGVSNANHEELAANLRAGGAALVVMADDFEVDATKSEMVRSGGKTEVFAVPAETAVAITEAVGAQAEASEAVDEAVEQVAEETARKMVQEMPELSPEDAAAVAKIVAATSLSSEEAAKLHAAGIDTASALLGLAATPEGRKELAETTGLSDARVLAGVKKLDLMRIPGIGVEQGALLLAAGVDTVSELAQRNPTNLHAALTAVNAEQHIVADMPEESEVAAWVEQAKAAPSIITY